MNVLYLGPYRRQIAQAIYATGDTVRHTEERIAGSDPLVAGADCLVSYGYRHILRTDVLSRFQGCCFNLHISLLPWNRGADPNLWSILEDTPTGVTIHLIDEGVDTGDILLQHEVSLRADDTLRTSYARLSETVAALFIENWPRLRNGQIVARPQPSGGTEHRMREREAVQSLLHAGWDTPIADIADKRKIERNAGAA